MLGAIEYRHRRSEPITLGILQGYVSNEGHAWQYTLDELSRYFERVLALPPERQAPVAVEGGVLELAPYPPPAEVVELIDNYLESAELLGRRTAELHLALAAEVEQPEFAPEPFSTLYQRSLYQSLRNLKRRAFDQLRREVDSLDEGAQSEAHRVLAAEETVLQRFREVVSHKVEAVRTRFHGDYHLGHVLWTGRDFVIIDFEGESDRSINDRRLKRSPLRDVVSMVRSFHYAAYGTLFGLVTGRGSAPGLIRPEDMQTLGPWARVWYSWVSATFLRAYLQTAAGAAFLPRSAEQLQVLFNVFLLEKAVQELLSELTQRRAMVRIPLLGILQSLEPA
jgi:maltose alpha-D-glucosyltransferase/alpha-amylase